MEGESMKKVHLTMGSLVIFAFIGLVVLLVGPPGGVSAAEKIIFQFDWLPYGKHVGYYAAKERGFYKAVGLDVTFERGYGGSSSSVGAGKQDYGIDCVVCIIVARNKNVPVKLVSMWHERLMMVVYALKSSGIRTPKDLEGRKIGGTAGAAAEVVFPVFAEAVGLKKSSFVPMRPAAKNPSLLAKKMDAIITYATVGVVLRVKAKKKGEEVVEFLYGDYGVRLAQDGIITHDKTMAEKPGQVRRLVAASLKGNAWAIEHPEEGVDIFMRYVPEASRKMTRGSWNLSSRFQVWGNLKKHGLGYIDREIVKSTRKTAARIYKMKYPPPLKDIYTTKFLPDPLPRAKLP
jgi:NitT/TauT family transport system substrate-binding protein